MNMYENAKYNSSAKLKKQALLIASKNNFSQLKQWTKNNNPKVFC